MGNCLSVKGATSVVHQSELALTASKDRRFSTNGQRPIRGNSLIGSSEFSLVTFQKWGTSDDQCTSREQKLWLCEKIRDEEPFNALSSDTLCAVADAFFSVKVDTNKVVADTAISESAVFVVEKGLLTKGKKRYLPGSVVGSKHLIGRDNDVITTSPYADDGAPLKAAGDDPCVLWVLTRTVYQHAIISFAKENQEKFCSLVRQIPALAPLTENQRLKVATQLRRVKFFRGDEIVRQGDFGNAIYFIDTGQVEVVQRSRGSTNKVVNVLGPGSYFGEASLYGDGIRNADVVAKTNLVYAWRLTRADFETLLGPLHALIRINSVARVLRRVKEFSRFSDTEIEMLASKLETRRFSLGDYVIKQGDDGDEMFILETGEIAFFRTTISPKIKPLEDGESINFQLNFGVKELEQHPVDERKDDFLEAKMTELKTGKPLTQDIGHLFANQYFGEGALLTNAPRRASAKVVSAEGATCYVLSGERFRRLFGDELKGNFNSKFAKRASAEDDISGAMIQLKEMEGIKLLGRGSYGKVTLVRHVVTGKTFALKQISKEKVETLDQHDHINNEKCILASINHPMVCNLIKTFKNRTSLYMLMDAVLGGELFQLLHKRVKFSEKATKFYVAQVTLVFEYLHSRKIAFRDLKPENIMIHQDGYIKVCDFGLAKILNNGRTYTLCGTPAYAAPEVYAVVGHDTSVDWWTLGVLLHELHAGYTPFIGCDANQVYSELRRYEMYYPKVSFPRHFSQISSDILKSLLHPRPKDRLGASSDGAKAVMSHTFFDDISFADIMAKQTKPPHIPTIDDCYDTSNFKARKDDFEKELMPAPPGYRHESWCAKF